MNWTRIKDDIAILTFAAILSFVLVLSIAGALNTERILDYRVMQAKQALQEVNHGHTK